MIKGFLKCLLLGAVVLTWFNPAAAADKKYIVARVGDVDITVFELLRESQRIMPFNKTFHGGVSKERMLDIRIMAFEKLVEQAYKVHFAKQNGISSPEDKVRQKVQKVLDKFGSKESLEKALGDETLGDFEQSVERIYLAEKAEEIVVGSQIKTGDEELLTFYRANTFMYQRPKQYRASHILVKVDPSLVGEERQKLVDRANELAEKAMAGEDFYNLAYYNSDEDTKFVGGDIGYFHSGQTVKEFEDAIKDLEPGDIVGPVETISGFHVIKLVDVREAGLLTFDEVKAKIRKTIEDKKRKELYNTWMKKLEDQLQPEVYHPDLKS